jgi:hypothetical protein
MKTEIQPSLCRVGKMQNWHKLITFLGVIMSLISGVAWFVTFDLFEQQVSEIRLWIYFHGISGHLFLLILGMAFYHHVQVCVKMKKNLFLGGAFIASSILLIVSILALYYGTGFIQEQAHWIHIISGSLVGIVFFLHIQIGKKSLALGVVTIRNKQIA